MTTTASKTVYNRPFFSPGCWAAKSNMAIYGRSGLLGYGIHLSISFRLTLITCYLRHGGVNGLALVIQRRMCMQVCTSKNRGLDIDG